MMKHRLKNVISRLDIQVKTRTVKSSIKSQDDVSHLFFRTVVWMWFLLTFEVVYPTLDVS